MAFDVWSISIIIIKFISYAATLLSAGSFLFAVILKPDAKLSTKSWNILAIVLAIIASFLLIPLNVGLFNDDGFSGMFDFEIFKIVIDSPIGDSTLYRILGLIILLIGLRFIGILYNFIGAIAVLIIGWSFTQIGHLSNIEPSLIKLLLILHLLGVAYWIGAFIPLYRAANGLLPDNETADLAHRFGQLAVYIVVGLFIGGVIMAFNLLASPSQLFSTVYGRTLGFKILIFFALLGLAALNKLRLVPALKTSQPNATTRLQQSIMLESLLVATIFIITAILTTVTQLPAQH
ncbi:MAG: CopD family protein [Lentilitoribacter sp.]